MTLLSVSGALLLVLLNGFFVAAEFSIVKVRRTRLEELVGKGVKAAKVSLAQVNQLDEYLSATQLGITLVSLGLGWIGEAAFAELLMVFFPNLRGNAHLVAVVLAFCMITVLHMVIGELVPKSIAIQDPEKISLRVAKPLQWFYLLTRPAIHFFSGMARAIARGLGYRESEEEALSEQELILVMQDSTEEGVITESEARIISRALEFSDKRASQIMVPADCVVFLSLTRTFEENLKTVEMHRFTRFPLCRKNFSSIIGVVHMKDAWPLLLNAKSNEAFERVCRLPLYISPDLRQDRIMKAFQSRRAHMAVVQEPSSKKNLGLVTMEDVLEELVGPIQDEHGN